MKKSYLLVPIFILLAIGLIIHAQDGDIVPCYTKEEAVVQADKNVAEYDQCCGPRYEECTKAYRIAEDIRADCSAACESTFDNGPDIRKCKDGCDAALDVALNEYNACIAKAEANCEAIANEKYPSLPVCPEYI